jgi:hypothetical protein
MKSHFAGRDFGEGENSGRKTSDKYILGKSHFEDEERLRRKTPSQAKRDFGELYL